MTVDNLEKRNIHKNKECVFCCEKESINHRFFECVVAKVLWELASEFLEENGGQCYENVATLWLCPKRHSFTNIVTSMTLRVIWLTRNKFIFQQQCWEGVKTLLRMAWRLGRDWQVMLNQETSLRL